MDGVGAISASAKKEDIEHTNTHPGKEPIEE